MRSHGQQLAALPGPADDRVGLAGAVDHSAAPRDARTTRSALGGADDEPALEAEARGQPVEHDARLEDRVGDVVEARADVDERLQVGAALAQLALVHGREDRRRQGEEPERGDVEDRHAVEVDRHARG